MTDQSNATTAATLKYQALTLRGPSHSPVPQSTGQPTMIKKTFVIKDQTPSSVLDNSNSATNPQQLTKAKHNPGKRSRDPSPIQSSRHLQTFEILANANKHYQHVGGGGGHTKSAVRSDLSQHQYQQQQNVSFVNANQIYLTSKQAEQAALIGAQIILNQYLKVQNKQNKGSVSQNNSKKQHKRDKLQPRKESIERAKEQILQKIINPHNISNDSQNNTQFLPHIQQAKIIGNQKTSSQMGASLPSTKHEPKKSFNQNETDTIIRNVNRNTHKNLITFIEEQKKFVQEKPTPPNAHQLSVGQFISNHSEVRKTKSFINKLEMKDRDMMIDVNNNHKGGNFFQSSAKTSERIDQLNKYNASVRGSQQMKNGLQKQNQIVNTSTLQLPQISNKPYKDKSDNDQGIMSARHSLQSEIKDTHMYFNINFKQQSSQQLTDLTQARNLFPDQSQSNRVRNQQEVQLPFTNRKSSNLFFEREILTDNPQVTTYTDTKPTHRKQNSKTTRELLSERSKTLVTQESATSQLSLEPTQINLGKEYEFEFRLQTQQQKPKMNDQIYVHDDGDALPQDKPLQTPPKSTKTGGKAIIYFNASQGKQSELGSKDKGQTQQSSLITGFLKQRMRFKSPQDEKTEQTRNRLSLQQSIQVQSMALSTQQSCSNILLRNSNFCLKHNENQTVDLAADQQTHNHDDLMGHQKLHQITPGRLRYKNVLSQCNLCQNLQAPNNRSSLGTYHLELNTKKRRLQDLLSHKGSNLNISVIKQNKEYIQQLFQQTKKLPAMTVQKHEQTMRIGFSRRQNMENAPLIVLVFNEFVGLLDSQWDPSDKKKINQKLYLKKGITSFLRELLEKFQVALFIDIQGKEKAQWVKEQLLQKEELMFDGIYTFNYEESYQQHRISIEQLVLDFGIDAKRSAVTVIQPIKYESLRQEVKPDVQGNIIRESQYQFESAVICNIIVGQSQYNLETISKLINNEDISKFKQVQLLANDPLWQKLIDLKDYYQQQNQLIEIQESQIAQKGSIAPDIKISGLLCNLRDRNQNIMNEMRKYINYYKSKYCPIQEVENNNLQFLQLYDNTQQTSIDNTNYHTQDNHGNDLLQQSEKNLPYFKMYSMGQEFHSVTYNDLQKLESEGKEDSSAESSDEQPLPQSSTTIIGQRSQNILEDFVLIDQREVKSSCLNVLDWLSKK